MRRLLILSLLLALLIALTPNLHTRDAPSTTHASTSPVIARLALLADHLD